MKKRKILVLFPFLGLLLSGCTIQEGFESVKDFFGDKVFTPIKDWITGGGDKKDEQGDDEETKTYVEITKVSAPSSIKKGETLAPSQVSLDVKYKEGSKEGTETVKAEKVELDTSVAGDAVVGKAHFKSLSKEFTIKVTEEGGGGGQAETGSLESPISLSKFQSEVDKLIDYSTVESGKTVTDPNNLFFVKGKVTSNYAPNDDGEIQYLNLVDLENESVAVTGYFVLVDSSVTETITKDSLVGAEVVVKGYGALFNHSQKGKTYEIMKKDNDNRAYLMSVKAPDPTVEPEMINATLAEIVNAGPNPSQAYVSHAQIRSWANNGGAKAEEVSEYGNMIITDGEHDVYVYGASGVPTDLAWNEATGTYKFTNSKTFKTNELTKDLQPGYYIDFYGYYYDYQGTKEMSIVITGSRPGDVPPEPPVPAGQTKVSKTSQQLQEENDWTVCSGSGDWEAAKFDGFDLDPNIHVSFTGTGNTATYWSSGTEIRIYGTKGTSEASVTFTGGEGVTIVSVKLTFKLSGTDASFPLESGTASEVNKNSETYALTCGANANGQVKISAFEVIYSGGVPTQKTLDHISVEGPTKKSYFVGESLDTSGLVVKAHYLLGEEESEVVLEGGYTITPEGAFTADDIPSKTFTVSYTEGGVTKTATFDVEVAKKEAELLSVTISGTPEKTAYVVGEKYSAKGLKVEAFYAGDTQGTDVTEAVTINLSKETAVLADNNTEIIATTTYEGVASNEYKFSVTVSEADVSVKTAYEAAMAVTTEKPSTDEMTFVGTVVSVTGKSYVVQDGEYGINVYNFETADVAVGKLVEVTSTLKLYNGCPQTDSVKSATVKGDGTAQVSSVVASKTELDALNHNVLAHVEDAIFVSKNYTWAGDKTSQFVFEIGGENITVSFDKVGFADEKGAVANAAVAGEHFELTGLTTGAYKGVNQLSFGGTAGIVKTSDAPVADPQSVSISGSSSVQVDSTITLSATVSPGNAPQDVEWSLEQDGDYASIDEKGVLTGLAVGEVKVIATAVGFEEVFGEKTITVTAKPIEPTEQEVYTLTPASGSNNSYAGNCDIEINGVTWNLTGNSTMQPWRLGGKSLSGVDRTLYSKTAIADDISKIEVEHGAAASITVNSWTLVVSKNDDFSDPVSTLDLTFAASSKTTITRPENADWSNCYFKFVYNLTVSGTANKFIEFTGASFYAVK